MFNKKYYFKFRRVSIWRNRNMNLNIVGSRTPLELALGLCIKQSLTKISTYFLFIHSNIYPLIYLIIHLFITNTTGSQNSQHEPP